MGQQESASGWGQIDEKLAKGLARQAIREAAKRAQTEFRLRGTPKVTNLKARQRAYTRLKAGLSETGCLIGMKTDKEVSRVVYSWVETNEFASDSEWRCVSVAIARMNVLPAAPSLGFGSGFAEGEYTVCGLDLHAMQRIMQRGNLQTLDQAVDFIRPVLGWCDAIIPKMNQTGFLPLGEGLVALEGRPSTRGRVAMRIVTYLHGAELSLFHRKIRAMLEPLAAAAPGFPRLRIDPTSSEEALIPLVWRTGKMWSDRAAERANREATR